jgi:hypothetical protein
MVPDDDSITWWENPDRKEFLDGEDFINESQNTQAINRNVAAAGVYCLKIQTMNNNGVPDVYYSGSKGSMWIEMKYISEERIPKKETTQIPSLLSSLQASWLDCRYLEGRTVAVVIGSRTGHCIQTNPNEWGNSITIKDLTLTRKQVVAWILNQIHD